MQVMPKQFIPAAIIAVITLILTNSAMGQSTPQSLRLSYEPAIVTLSGTLVRKTFPGPPNYESVKKGDRPETSWFLDLQESVCVNTSKTEPDLNPSRVAFTRFTQTRAIPAAQGNGRQEGSCDRNPVRRIHRAPSHARASNGPHVG